MGKATGGKKTSGGRKVRSGGRSDARRGGKVDDILRKTQGTPRGPRGTTAAFLIDGSADEKCVGEAQEQSMRDSYETNVQSAENNIRLGQHKEAKKDAQKAIIAKKCLDEVSGESGGAGHLRPLCLLGDVYMLLGDPENAQKCFLDAAKLDPDASVPFSKVAGGGVEKFFNLAQLSEEGGLDSLQWIDKGISALRREIDKSTSKDKTNSQLVAQSTIQSTIEDTSSTPSSISDTPSLPDLQQQLALALCSKAELYMTDLSFDPSAEENSVTCATEAVALSRAANTADPSSLQCLANIRISQDLPTEGRDLVTQSMVLWNAIPRLESAIVLDTDSVDENTDIFSLSLDSDPSSPQPPFPDYATLISLARLLLELSMLKEAELITWLLMRLDDESIEAHYLAGFTAYLQFKAISSPEFRSSGSRGSGDGLTPLAEKSLETFATCLDAFHRLDYEDERMKEHMMEMVAELVEFLGKENELVKVLAEEEAMKGMGLGEDEEGEGEWDTEGEGEDKGGEEDDWDAMDEEDEGGDVAIK